MKKRKNSIGTLLVAVLLIPFWGGSTGQAWSQENYVNQIADVVFGSSSVSFRPKVSYSSLTLSVSKPDGTLFQQTFSSGSMPYFQLSGEMIDGSYTYELRLMEAMKSKVREEPSQPGKFGNEPKKSFFDKYEGQRQPVTQTGHFLVEKGRIITTDSSEYDPKISVQDQVILDDLIVQGSLAVGLDAINGENFGFDTVRLKENNLRIHFNDTSVSAGFPTNDWRIVINDSNSGGANYFAVQDADSGKYPFLIEAGARANALYVDDSGRVGIGTSTPAEDLQIWYGDTPTIRLEQSGGGWAPQTWDVAGNEANFFIRDVTNASKLPFRIRPNAPLNSIYVHNDGKIGFGTQSPAYRVEVETTGENSAVVCDRTDGARNFMNATDSYGQFGTVTNHPTRILVNSAWKMVLNSNNSLEMASGATCTTTGVWTNNSSIKYKENIKDLTAEEAAAALEDLNPVKFNYKVDKEDEYVGFIAEDVPELVATKDREGMSSMDVVAVLTKVVKEQQKTIQDLQNNVVKEQQKTIEELKKRIEELEKKNNKEK